MTIIDPASYRTAFVEYLRKGTPIRLSNKQEHPTTHYVWRTRADEDVRPSHAANDGQIFAWDNPPSTGNPGSDFGCRCTAEPYYPDASENITITLSEVSDTGAPWSWQDFVRHYFRENGRGVTVRQTGHLQNIVEKYMEIAGKSIQKHIATEARQNPNGAFADTFNNSYDMTGIVFSLGDTVIGGSFTGRAFEIAGSVALSGEVEFYLRDVFADPVDLGEAQRQLGIDDARDVEIIDLGETIFQNVHRPIEDYLRGRVGLPPTGPQQLGISTGVPYSITDEWRGTFEGQILLDPNRSDFR